MIRDTDADSCSCTEDAVVVKPATGYEGEWADPGTVFRTRMYNHLGETMDFELRVQIPSSVFERFSQRARLLNVTETDLLYDLVAVSKDGGGGERRGYYTGVKMDFENIPEKEL